MKKTIIAVMLTVLLPCAPGSAARASSLWDNGVWRVGIDERTGAVTRLEARLGLEAEWKSLLPGEGSAAGVSVRDAVTGADFGPGDRLLRPAETERSENSLVVRGAFELGGETIGLELEYMFRGYEVCWRARLEKHTPGNRGLRVAFELPVRAGWELWLQNRVRPFPAASAGSEVSAWYVRAPEGYDRFDNQYPRNDLTLPLTAAFSRDEGLGLTVAHHPRERIPSAGFVLEGADRGEPLLRAVTALTGPRGGRPLEVTGFLVAHEPCFRPGLGWMMNRWPELFLPDEGIYDKQGIYSIGDPGTGARGEDGEFNYEGLLEYDATFFEMHAHFPWYGLYFPDNPESDVWADLRKLERGRASEDALSVEVINRRLENLDDAGFDTFYYFAVNDGYPPEVHERWPESVAHWPESVALSGWRGGGIEYRNMNADTSLAFGRDLLRQVNGIISTIGPLAGIFFDTVHHNDLDFAHDDGLTLVNLDGRSVPAYSINFAYDFFLEHISRELHRRDQYLFINGPAAIRNALGVDAIMLEGEGGAGWEDEFEYRRFLSCMARPMIWLFPSRPRKSREVLLQRCLLYAAVPSAPPSAREQDPDPRVAAYEKRLWTPFLPLYNALRGRTLCFEPDPVSAPPGCRAEVYTMPDGDYAVTLINENMSVLDPANRDTPLLRLRLQKKADKVEVMRPGGDGRTGLDYGYNSAGELEVRVEGFSGAAVLFVEPD